MFVPTEIERAVDLQQRSYALLRWATDAVDKGFLAFDTLHSYASLPGAALAWLESHYENVPKAARPERDDLRDFVKLFATYLEGSFDLIEDPGLRLVSPQSHCFCPMCSWLVKMPRLRAKRLVPADKELARRLMVESIVHRAAHLGRILPASVANDLVAEPGLRETTALVAYGDDLLRRVAAGTSYGPATLALWRRFAWTTAGSPRQDFDLEAALILDAEQTLIARLG